MSYVLELSIAGTQRLSIAIRTKDQGDARRTARMHVLNYADSCKVDVRAVDYEVKAA